MPNRKAARNAIENKEIEHRKKLQTFCSLKCALLVIFTLICNLCCRPLKAQNEIQYSGIANLPIIVNPGCAGQSGSVKAIAGYRAQWVGFEDAPSTSVLGIDAEVKFLKSFHGIGAMVIYDQIGEFTDMSICANYSYHIELDKGLLGIGARVGALNVAFDASNLSPAVSGMENDYHQESDEALQGSDESATAFDIGLGAFFQSKKSYLSLALLHLTAPTLEQQSGTEINVKPIMAIGAGRLIKDGGEFTLEPRVFFKTDFASCQFEFSGTANIKEKVSVGLGYRLQDAIFLQVGVNLSNGLFVGYDYDISVSKLTSYNSGSHEIMVSYSFDLDIEKRTKRYKSVRIL